MIVCCTSKASANSWGTDPWGSDPWGSDPFAQHSGTTSNDPWTTSATNTKSDSTNLLDL